MFWLGYSGFINTVSSRTFYLIGSPDGFSCKKVGSGDKTSCKPGALAMGVANNLAIMKLSCLLHN